MGFSRNQGVTIANSRLTEPKAQSPLPKNPMKDKDYSWKGSPNAGFVLAIFAAIAAVALVLAGFN